MNRSFWVCTVVGVLGVGGAAVAHEVPAAGVRVGEVRDAHEVQVGEVRDASEVEMGEVRDLPAAQPPVEIAGGSDARLQGVELRETVGSDGSVIGSVANRSDAPVQNVQLLVSHSWLWANEKNPGDSGPGRARYVTLPGLLPPNKSVEFRYEPVPALPHRTDGRFETTAEIIGFDRITYEKVPRDRVGDERSGLQ